MKPLQYCGRATWYFYYNNNYYFLTIKHISSLLLTVSCLNFVFAFLLAHVYAFNGSAGPSKAAPTAAKRGPALQGNFPVNSTCAPVCQGLATFLALGTKLVGIFKPTFEPRTVKWKTNKQTKQTIKQKKQTTFFFFLQVAITQMRGLQKSIPS